MLNVGLLIIRNIKIINNDTSMFKNFKDKWNFLFFLFKNKYKLLDLFSTKKLYVGLSYNFMKANNIIDHHENYYGTLHEEKNIGDR